jgi:hypothetical protein
MYCDQRVMHARAAALLYLQPLVFGSQAHEFCAGAAKPMTWMSKPSRIITTAVLLCRPNSEWMTIDHLRNTGLAEVREIAQ